MRYNYKLPDDSLNNPKENILLFTLKLTVSLAVIAVFSYFILSFGVNYAVSHITPEQEIKLMEYVQVDMNLSGEQNQYLSKIANKLQVCAKLPYDIKIYKLGLDQANAFAVPGGSIYITQGMLSRLKSENELAFIIGHEMGHFKNRDHIRGIGKSFVLSLLSMLLSDNYGLALSTTLEIGQAKYSQSAELEADKFGLEVMHCAYGSVRDATQFFEKMSDENSWKYFMATHPAFDKRVQRMQELINENGYDTSKNVISLKKF